MNIEKLGEWDYVATPTVVVAKLNEVIEAVNEMNTTEEEVQAHMMKDIGLTPMEDHTLREEIAHVNPQCLNSNWCKPHGEEGAVEYDPLRIQEDFLSKRQEELDDLEAKVKALKKDTSDWNEDKVHFNQGVQAALDEITKL